MKFPAPDFVAEVLSPSTEQADRGVKFQDYAAHGVGEYWILDSDAARLEQYLLDGESYTLAIKAGDGTVTSLAVTDFTIPVRALFDEAENLAALERLVAGS
jgi:Uma2 family endonuclease